MHRTVEHKSTCGKGFRRSDVLKLAERSLAVPKLVEWFIALSALTLNLSHDVTAADRFALNIVCTVLPSPATLVSDSMGQGSRSLYILDFIAVPQNQMPSRTQVIGRRVREASRRPVLVLYFSTPQDTTGDDGLVSVAYPIGQRITNFMAARTAFIQSAGLGDVMPDLNKENLIV